MKIEHGVNEKGEPTISYSMEIPPSIDPKDWDAFAAIVALRANEAIRANLDAFWLEGRA
jgi:hypothetical protein